MNEPKHIYLFFILYHVYHAHLNVCGNFLLATWNNDGVNRPFTLVNLIKSGSRGGNCTSHPNILLNEELHKFQNIFRISRLWFREEYRSAGIHSDSVTMCLCVDVVKGSAVFRGYRINPRIGDLLRQPLQIYSNYYNFVPTKGGIKTLSPVNLFWPQNIPKMRLRLRLCLDPAGSSQSSPRPPRWIRGGEGRKGRRESREGKV